MRRGTRGSTLLELLVVLTIVAIIAGVTGLSFRAPENHALTNPAEVRIADARREAIRSGRAVTVITWRDEQPITATAHPDGRVVADTGVAIDRFSGRPAR